LVRYAEDDPENTGEAADKLDAYTSHMTESQGEDLRVDVSVLIDAFAEAAASKTMVS
jgi:hypothetical protein